MCTVLNKDTIEQGIILYLLIAQRGFLVRVSLNIQNTCFKTVLSNVQTNN